MLVVSLFFFLFCDLILFLCRKTKLSGGTISEAGTVPVYHSSGADIPLDPGSGFCTAAPFRHLRHHAQMSAVQNTRRGAALRLTRHATMKELVMDVIALIRNQKEMLAGG